MKKAFLLFAQVIILVGCNNSPEENKQTDPANSTEADTATTAQSNGSPAAFDVNSIPVSTAEIGEFPFFSFPKGMEAQNKPLKRSFDRLYFPLNGVMTPLEGKTWKSFVTNSRENQEEWSLTYFLKSYDDFIIAAGGVKVFDGKVAKPELEKFNAEAKYLGEEGSIDYYNEPVQVYVIRRTNGDDIYVQISGNSASGALQVLQKEPFKQTISFLKSDEIKKQLDASGKAILHINFDTDKATLKPDGISAVGEIIQVLKSDPGLKMAINGYTDDSGDELHNLNLSKERAATVLNAIVASGIENQRLVSNGFGAKDPIADNKSEEGKAKNRRVELIKQ